MQINLKAWLFHSNSFCCCLPVRAGFLLMSILTFLLSGTISVIIWFEIFHSHQLSSKERVAFILTGIVESLLFLVSIVGFIGVVARKQLFVMIYTYFLYAHFLLNIVVGIYFLVTVRASNRQELIDYCAQALVNTSTESFCSRLMTVSTYVFIAIVAALLLLELYGVLIATRYVHRLRVQKRDDRARRLGYFHALSQPETPSMGHTRQASDNIELLHSRESTNVDPEDILDISPQKYIPVSMHDHDLPLAPTAGPSLSPPYSFSSDTTTSRHVRALPPRPDMVPPVATRASDRLRIDPGWRERQPKSHESSNHPDSEDERAEVSTTAHSALMDHAAYMESMFARSQRSLR